MGYLWKCLLIITIVTQIECEDKGRWEQWGRYSTCSRTCGGGVQQRTRRCIRGRSHMNGMCVGPDIEYSSCNTQPCPADASDFRSEQCSRYNRVKTNGLDRLYHWVPKIDSECVLKCEASERAGLVREFAPRVIDGTRCDGIDSFGICVAGVCQAVGCDRVIGSFTKEDKCRVCGGDGSTCQTITDIYDQLSLSRGLHEIVTIPSGATSIVIRELRNSHSHLAVKNDEGNYYINGRLKTTKDNSMSNMAGTTIHYIKKPDFNDEPETLSALGPTNETLHIELMLRDENPGVQYEYSVQKSLVHEAENPQLRYTWINGVWTRCSKSCGQGLQLRQVSCIDRQSGVAVSSDLCDVRLQPDGRQVCRLQDCPEDRIGYSWVLGHWGECTNDCGIGEQMQLAYCQEKGTMGKAIYTDDNLCLRYVGLKPVIKKVCEGVLSCPHWAAGSWLECSVTCGYGSQFRHVFCQEDPPNSDEEPLRRPIELCSHEKRPTRQRMCTLSPCPDGSNKNYLEFEESDEIIAHCAATLYGCCSDGKTRADNWKKTNCGPSLNKDNVITDCRRSQYGCCDDDETMAAGPNKEGCPGGSDVEVENVCGDYGCCADGVTLATGPHHQGCPSQEHSHGNKENCHDSTYGCCSDGKTMSSGPGGEGCPESHSFDMASAPQNITITSVEMDYTSVFVSWSAPAQTAGELLGYLVFYTTQPQLDINEWVLEAVFGNKLQIKILDLTPGSQYSFKMQTRSTSGYGVISDATVFRVPESSAPDTSATGALTSGTSTSSTASCGLKKDKGRCGNFTIQWFYDSSNNVCGQFWYGGCGGNDNRFESKYMCQGHCMDVKDEDICKLPPSKGPCRARHTRYYYDHNSQTCRSFTYGGCRGNQNRFRSQSDCERKCSANYIDLDSDVLNEVNGASSLCENSVYGCCSDGITAAEGPYKKGCSQRCQDTIYGCCDDLVTIAQGPDQEGCEIIMSGDDEICESSQYGCCNDGVTKASGPNKLGCLDYIPGGTKTKVETVNVCMLKEDYGIRCNNSIKWYFNKSDSQCKRFWYGGCGGNGNNFESKEVCQEVCIMEEPTSPEPEPETTPRATYTDPCQEPKVTGPCRASLDRYYYDSREGRCRMFVYGGCQANGNNFVFKEDCERRCVLQIVTLPPTTTPTTPIWHRPGFYTTDMPVYTGEPRIILTGTEYVQLGRQLRLECKVLGDVRKTRSVIWYKDRVPVKQNNEDNITIKRQGYSTGRGMVSVLTIDSGRREDAGTYICRGIPHGKLASLRVHLVKDAVVEEVTKPEKISTTLPPTSTTDPRVVCMQPSVTGNCYANFIRYHYDHLDGQCKEFTYGGCGANSNSFETKTDCENYCRPELICRLSAQRGVCRAMIERYFYDVSLGRCRTFSYGGCQGNPNNFESWDTCNNFCQRQDSRETSTSNVCQLSRDGGKCDGYHIKWYFEESISRCTRFIYTGCDGNGNRFDTREECSNRCVAPKSKLPVTRAPVTRAPVTRAPVTRAPVTRAPVTRAPYSGDVCSLKENRGTLCSNWTIYWYYNSGQQRCQRFYYGGCHGNDNRFATNAECRLRCVYSRIATTTPVSVTRPTVRPDREDRVLDTCSMSSDNGRLCSNWTIHWFYNSTTQRCQRFYYGGCDGNDNRFDTRRLCSEKCYYRRYASYDTTTQAPRPQTTLMAPTSIEFNYTSSRTNFTWGVTWGKNIEHSNYTYNYTDNVGETGNYTNWPERNYTVYPERNYTRWQLQNYTEWSGPVNSTEVEYWPERNYTYIYERNYTEQNYTGWKTNFTSGIFNATEVDYGVESSTVPPKIDVCSLSGDVGRLCSDWKIYWYYDSDKQRCSRFYYGGCDGNDNRFETEADCQNKCDSKIEVTTQGSQTNIPLEHTLIISENIEIPEQSGDEIDVCSLSEDSGRLCSNWTIYWYYNSDNRRCSRFYYGGCDGNDNRFKTVADCKNKCDYRERETTTQAVQSMTTTEPTKIIPVVSGRNYTVLTLNRTDTDHITRQELDVCSLKANNGRLCSNWTIVWYYNSENKKCQRFYYGGCDGNDNRFKSMADCRNKCYGYTRVISTTQATPTRSSIVVEETGTSETKVGGKAVQSMTTTEPTKVIPVVSGRNYTVLTLNRTDIDHIKKQKIDLCSLKSDRGRLCSNWTIVWYYNSEDKKCQNFYYGGCDGNDNRFETEADCQNKCQATPTRSSIVVERNGTSEFGDRTDLCALSSDTGRLCSNWTIHWFYNSTTRRCQRFYYGGCDGNDNRFDSRRECRTTCAYTTVEVTRRPVTRAPPTRRPFTRAPITVAPPTRQTVGDVCELNEDSGRLCSNWTIHWYYNSDNRRCSRFYYGGCDGNENRFETETDCRRKCQSIRRPQTTQAPPPVTTRRPFVLPGVTRQLDDCRFSRYGCCGDGQTAAADSIRTNCYDEPNVIERQEDGNYHILTSAGRKVELNCQLQETNPGQVLWFRGSYRIIPGHNIIEYYNGTMVIQAVTEEHNGEYSCQIGEGNEVSLVQRFMVQVRTPLKIQPGPKMIAVKPGENAFLHCQARGSPKPTVKWFQDGRPVYTRGRYNVYNNGTLIILNTQDQDRGYYECRASNGEINSMKKRKIKLEVRETVTVRIEGHKGQIKEGETLTLKCEVNGFPTPKLTWRKDMDDILESDNVYVRGNELVILKASHNDTGVYRCVGDNGVQKQEAITTVQVKLQELSDKCEDSVSAMNCKLIKAGRLCGHRTFSKMCCHTCSKSVSRRHIFQRG